MIRRPRILTNTALTDRAGDRQELGVLLGIQLICEGWLSSSLAWQVLIRRSWCRAVRCSLQQLVCRHAGPRRGKRERMRDLSAA